MQSSRPKFKILYKIIITFIGVIIIPLAIIDYGFHVYITQTREQHLKEKLKDGRNYLETYIRGARLNFNVSLLRLVDDPKLHQAIMNAINQKPIDSSKLITSLAEYGLHFIRIYDETYKPIYTVAFTFVPRSYIKVPPKDLEQAKLKDIYYERFVEEGLLFKVAKKIEVSGYKNVLLVTGKIEDTSFLDELREALKLDFSFATNKKFLQTTLYNEYGLSLNNKPIPITELTHILSSMPIKDEGYFTKRIIHLNRIYAAYIFNFPLRGEAKPIKAIIMQEMGEFKIEDVFKYVLLLSVAILGLIVLASLFLTTNIVRPITHLASKIENLREDIVSLRKPEVIKPKTRDEIALLTQAFNEFGFRLYEAYSELKKYSEKLEDMVRERTEQLRKAYEQMQQELEVAGGVQKAMLPPNDQNFDNIKIYYKWMPKEQTSGDYLDITQISNGLIGVVFMDVSGHGVPSALVSTMAKVAFFNQSRNIDADTAQICAQVNSALYDFLSNTRMYLTAFYFKITPAEGKIQYTNSGHLPALHYKADSKEVTKLDTQGVPIGSIPPDMATMLYSHDQTVINPGDKIIVYSDGIEEAKNPKSELFGHDRVVNFLSENGHLPTKEFVEKLLNTVNNFTEGRGYDDDVTIIVIEHTT